MIRLMAGAIPLSVVLFMLLLQPITAATIGLNYGRLARNLPSPYEAVELVRSLKVTKVRIYDTDATVLQAFANTGIELTVSIPNEDILTLATSPATAQTWVNNNIMHFYPHTRITTILVGNEVLTSVSDQQVTSLLITAMRNIYNALAALQIGSQVKVSTPHALSLLNVTLPPSLGSYNEQNIVRSMLQFLSETHAPFMVNIYPFFTFQQDEGRNFPESYALLNPTGFVVVDPLSRMQYANLFEAQLDAVYSAISALGYEDIQVIVSETGWPSSGSQVGANARNARSYVRNVARRCISGVGTPLRPGRAIEAFIYSLFNEDLKPGHSNFGLFHPNKTKIYNIDLDKILQHNK